MPTPKINEVLDELDASCKPSLEDCDPVRHAAKETEPFDVRRWQVIVKYLQHNYLPDEISYFYIIGHCKVV